MDSTIRAVAEKRYESDLENAHKILHDYFQKQPNLFDNAQEKVKW